MPSRGRSILLLSMAGVVALLVGIVRSGGRVPGRAPGAAVEPSSPEPRRSRVALVAPEVLPPAEPAPSPAPVQAPRSSAPAPVQTPAAVTGRLLGTVVHQDGEPAAGARVVLGRQHAECDAEGAFELALLDAPSADGGLDLVAHARGFEPALLPSHGANLDPRGDNRVRIVLGAPTLEISGSVTTLDGAPAKDWTVELDGLDPLGDFGLREPVRTDVDGRFTVPDVPSGVHVLLVHHGRRELGYRSLPANAGETGVAIVVGPE